MALLGGEFNIQGIRLELTTPVWITPEFSLSAIVNVALPLVIVAITGQFVPGMAVLRNDGFNTPASTFLTYTGLGSLLLAPFACHGLTLAAITAAICTGREAHEEQGRRYIAGIAGGVFYLLFGIFGATIVMLFMAFPGALIAALAGLALLGAIASSLANSMSVVAEREAALITFLVTASGMTMFGLASAFWGLLFGIVVHWILSWTKQPV